MRQSNGCSTPTPRSNATYQWTAKTSSKEEAALMDTREYRNFSDPKLCVLKFVWPT